MDAVAYTLDKQSNNISFKCSDGSEFSTDKWVDAITYFLEPCQTSCYGVVWNIDKFAADFISLLPAKNIKEINNTDRTILDNGEKIFYSAGRKLSITYGWINDQKRREVDIYGLHRYSDKPVNTPEELMTLWREVMVGYSYFGIVPQGLSSPIGAYEPLIDLIDFARACDLDEIGQELVDVFKGSPDNLAWQEWRETYILGHFQNGEVHDYDIISAYPGIMAKLPDLRHAKIIKSKDIPIGYEWGLMCGELNIEKDYTYFDMGKYERWITTGQLRQINQYHWGTFKQQQGYFIKFPKVRRYPFAELMNRLFEAKRSEQGMVKKLAKMIMNGLGGKFNSQYQGKPSKNYNPILAKMVSSGCEMKTADLVWSKPDELDKTVSVQVDGVLTQAEYDIPNLDCLGAWRKNSDTEFLVVSQNNQFDGLDEKHHELPYSRLMQMINDKPNQSIYSGIDLLLETYTRNFKNTPKTGKELLEKRFYSKPIIRT